jgi:predicted ArsR family transcriptional regulator
MRPWQVYRVAEKAVRKGDIELALTAAMWLKEAGDLPAARRTLRDAARAWAEERLRELGI